MSIETVNFDPKGEIIALMTLSSLNGVGYWTLRKLYMKHKSLKIFLKNCSNFKDLENGLSDAGSKVVLSHNKSFNDEINQLWNSGIIAYRHLFNMGIKVLVYNDPLFPQVLKNIPDPPYWLFVQGNQDVFLTSCIGLIGTRKPSADGKMLARYIGHLIGGFNCNIVSGLALGIDQIIHEITLEYGMPNISVMGTGLSLTYPKAAEPLRKKILENRGLIISEYLPNQSYSAENFVRRNRLQAGLSEIVIPIEWSTKSGTAHTVKFAYEYGKMLIFPLTPIQFLKDKEIRACADKYGAEIVVMPSDEEKLYNLLVTKLQRTKSTILYRNNQAVGFDSNE